VRQLHQQEQRGTMKIGTMKILQQLVSELQLVRYREQVKVEWVNFAQLVDKIFVIGFFISGICLLKYNHF